MSRLVSTFIGLTSLGILLISYFAVSDIYSSLSPQGCRMSWMSPSYVLQSEFNTTWSPLARRYSLWLYREVGWEPNQVDGGGGSLPVLFIPGNAGSSHQVRSIASSATRQFYEAPFVVSSQFAGRAVKPLDFFAVEFNEDLSAFHGPTLNSQIAYTASAISYILSLYPTNTQIIIMGHSMGGIVATALLASPSYKHDISAIITMSTPHTLPPARFDARIDAIYAHNRGLLATDATPVVSLCGGAADGMISSEACVLPAPAAEGGSAPYRRTVFTSALEGAWTGVGHREMVWCHQVRWRVARAALELGAEEAVAGRAATLDRWLRDGHTLPPISLSPPSPLTLADFAAYEKLQPGARLVLKDPRVSRMWLLPVPEGPEGRHFVLLVSQGSIGAVSPQNPIPLTVTVYTCTAASRTSAAAPECAPAHPTVVRLIPNPVPGRSFPVPSEGSDESEGVVLYELDVPGREHADAERWVAVRVEGADGLGWVVGAFGEERAGNDIGVFRVAFGSAVVTLPDSGALRIVVTLPNLLSHALVVYRVSARMGESATTNGSSACSDSLLTSLIMHTSQAAETHYFPLSADSQRILLHTHATAPYIPGAYREHGVSFAIYSSTPPGCMKVVELDVSIDWLATLGRWASRYPTTLVTWAVAVVAWVVFQAWSQSDRGAPVPTVQQSLSWFNRKALPGFMLLSFLLALLPLPEDYYLGNVGEPQLAFLAPLILLVASGLVLVSWWMLIVLMWPLGKIGRRFYGRRRESASVQRSTLVSMGLIFLLIFVFIPWQVAYLGCWVIHLYTCASSAQEDIRRGSVTPGVAAVPLVTLHSDQGTSNRDQEEDRDSIDQLPAAPVSAFHTSNYNHSAHLLLLMTWLLPLAAPVLAVWVRTLVTAGLTAPFDGDHFFLSVAPFLVLVDFASWTQGPLFPRRSVETRLSVRWAWAAVAAAAFLVGPRRVYVVFNAAKIAVGLAVLVRIGPRYWGSGSY